MENQDRNKNENEVETKEVNKENNDDIEKELEKIAASGEVSESDIEQLQELFKKLSSQNKEPRIKRVLKGFFGFVKKLLITLIIYISCFGILNSFINYDAWYHVILYILGLSMISVISGILLKCFKSLLINPIKYFAIKAVITLLFMASFNMAPQTYFYFKDVAGLIIFYIMSSVLSLGINYYMVKFMFYRR